MSDRVCPYCEAQLGPRAVDLRPNQFVESFLPRANQTAIIVVALNLIFYVGQLLTHGGLTGAGIEYGPYIAQGQWWRLITAGFLHGGIFHVGMNCYSLWILVTETEYFYGTSRLVVAYVVSTITGFALSAIWSPHGAVIGASCAAFGLMGTMLAIGLRNRADPLAQAVRAQYGQWLIYSVVLSFLPGVSLTGHLGGFAGGVAVGLIARLPGLPGSPKEAFWRFAAIASAALVVLAFFEMFTHYA